MRYRCLSLLLGLFLSAVLAGCLSAPGSPTAGAATPVASATPAPPADRPTLTTHPEVIVPAQRATSYPPGIREPVNDAIADLSKRLGVAAAEITVLEARPSVWPNKGLGCPHPGVEYPQLQVEGVLIRLRVGDHEYEYHGGGGRGPILCQ